MGTEHPLLIGRERERSMRLLLEKSLLPVPIRFGNEFCNFDSGQPFSSVAIVPLSVSKLHSRWTPQLSWLKQTPKKLNVRYAKKVFGGPDVFFLMVLSLFTVQSVQKMHQNLRSVNSNSNKL